MPLIRRIQEVREHSGCDSLPSWEPGQLEHVHRTYRRPHATEVAREKRKQTILGARIDKFIARHERIVLANCRQRALRVPSLNARDTAEARAQTGERVSIIPSGATTWVGESATRPRTGVTRSRC